MACLRPREKLGSSIPEQFGITDKHVITAAFGSPFSFLEQQVLADSVENSKTLWVRNFSHDVFFPQV